MTPGRVLGVVVCGLALGATPAGAQDPVDSMGVVIDGPPPPQPPAVIARAEDGRATIRAVRVERLTVDGMLNERVYQDVPPAAGFIQQEPLEGAPATERTELWVLFDDDHIYLSVRCWHSAPESEWIVNEMRRDSPNVASGEFVGVCQGRSKIRPKGGGTLDHPAAGRSV